MRLLKLSTARTVSVFMTDEADHVTGKTGLTLTITAGKAGAAFASITPTVTERGDGWYSLALTTSHTDTAGDLALHITGSAADPSDLLFQVVAFDPFDAAGLGLSRVDAAVSTRASQASVDTIDGEVEAIQTTADAIEADTQDIQGTVDALDTRIPAALTSGRMDSSVGAMAADTLTASALAADAVSEIVAGISVPSAATVADAVADELLSGHVVSGSVGEALGRIAAIKTKTDLITAGAITIAQPLDPETMALSLVRGDDYSGDRGLTFELVGLADLDGATVRLTIRERPRTASGVGGLDSEGEETDPVVLTMTDTAASRLTGSGTQSVTFEPLHTPGDPVVNGQVGGTDGLPVGRNAGKYDVEITHADGTVETPVVGVVHGTEDQTRAEE